MSNSQFIAIVGAVIVVSMVVLLGQKINACNASGGTACCFGRICDPAVKQSSRQP